MTTWKPLTEDSLKPLLDTSQRESLAARPGKGSSHDALSAALADATQALRDAIRANQVSILSEDRSLLPPEFFTDAAYLAIELLDGRITGFLATESQLDAASTASSTLSRIRSGNLPVSLPEHPESKPGVRTAYGPEVLSRRESPLSAKRLRGL